MNTINYFKMIAILLILAECFSCNEETTTSCDQQSHEEYLESFPKGTICTESLCNEYHRIWKEIFMEKNKISESYFNTHIEIKNSNIDEWVEGTSYSVGYYVKIGWAVVYTIDQFIINISEDSDIYLALKMPRGIYLTKKDILIAVNANAKAYASEIIKLTPDETLQFKSLSNALELLKQKACVSDLRLSRIYIDKETGHLNLEAHAQDNEEFNKCIFARLDLINKVTDIQNGPCFIN